MALSEDWQIWYTKAIETETHSLVPGRSAACLAGLAAAGLCAWTASGLDTTLLRRCFGGFLLVVGLRELFRKRPPTAQ